MDAAALKPFQADDLEHFQHLGADFLLGHLFQAQAESDILKHIQVREERILLEHRVHRPFVRRHIGDVLAIKKDIARFRGDKTGNHTQGCRLAAAGGAEEGDKFLVVDVQRESVQDLLPIEIDNNVFQRYDQIFIHFHCIPLCGISRYRASSRAVSSLGRHKVLDESAPIMPPRKGLLHGLCFAKSAASSTYNANVSGQKKFTLRCTHKIHYTAWRMFVNKNFFMIL